MNNDEHPAVNTLGKRILRPIAYATLASLPLFFLSIVYGTMSLGSGSNSPELRTSNTLSSAAMIVWVAVALFAFIRSFPKE